MKHGRSRLHPGDLVEIRSPEEILSTLDVDGTVDRLPFMPEMIEFCSKRFRVSKRVVKTCYYGLGSGMRKFRADDVVLLDGLRCSGVNHDGCQKACMIFWRESWLRRVEDPPAVMDAQVGGREQLRARLKTSTNPKTYFCQSSEILNATDELTHLERFGKSLSDIRAGNSSVLEMARNIGIWVFWKARRTLMGPYARGSQKATPAVGLNLQAGDWIEVKSVKEIGETLDERAYNRGLFFTPDMGRICGQKRRVERKIERIIVDGTGQMRQLRNTVYLEGSMCGCACVAFGGCPRGEFAYWREIWLEKKSSS